MPYARLACLLSAWIFLFSHATRLQAQSNILYNGGFELIDAGWTWSGTLGIRQINPYGGFPPSEGTTYLIVGGRIWQDVTTVPGRRYILRFATQASRPAHARFNESPITELTDLGTFSGWRSFSSRVLATSNISRLQFEIGEGQQDFAIDDVRLGWVDEPITILRQPEAATGVEAGAVTFSVVAQGGPPLFYQWFFGAEAISDATNRVLILTNVQTAAAGSYSVLVSNSVSFQISSNAGLSVEPLPAVPIIVSQPEGQTFPAGYRFSLGVIALGEPPLRYAWFRDGAAITNSTNSTLTFPAVQESDAGTYSVLVENDRGTVRSLSATLGVTNATGGGHVSVQSRRHNMPVFDVDGVTLLSGSNYLAQLYAGGSPLLLRPIGSPMPFGTGPFTGYYPGMAPLVPDVPPGATVYGQVRAWEAAWGGSYEEARARGGKIGFSAVASATAVEEFLIPPNLFVGSFSLRAGLPAFLTGRLSLERRPAPATVEWRLTGAAGFTYLVEKRRPPENWAPFAVLINTSGSVTFQDSAPPNSLSFYRARLLD